MTAKTSETHAYIDALYGQLPPAPPLVRVTLLHSYTPAQFNNAALSSVRVAANVATTANAANALELSAQFTLNVLRPANPAAILLSGDACWLYLTDAVMQYAIANNIALAWFNRCELAPDVADAPNFRKYGAIALWAWGMQRAVDAVKLLPDLADLPIAISGHSRGGKAALLAGALDTRIALTHANNSGCAGAASDAVQSAGSETLAQLARQFPHWLNPQWRGREHDLKPQQFEQSTLLAAHAPRQVLITQAIDDLWANPAGTRHAVALAQARSTANAIALIERSGTHAQTFADWQVVIDAAANLRNSN